MPEALQTCRSFSHTTTIGGTPLTDDRSANYGPRIALYIPMMIKRMYNLAASHNNVKAIYKALPILALSACIGGGPNAIGAEPNNRASQNHIYKDKSSSDIQLASFEAPEAGIPLIDVPAYEEPAEAPRANPVKVNSIAGVINSSNAQVIITSNELRQSLSENASEKDYLLALGSYAVAVELDRMLLLNNKFEQVPQYRVTHVVKTLIEQNRRHKNENPVEIYNRIVGLWETACQAQMAAGKGCDFIFKFNKNEWIQGHADMSQPLSAKHIAHLTPSFIEKIHGPSITDRVRELQKDGKVVLTFAGEDTIVRASKDESTSSMRKKVLEAWTKGYIGLHYLQIDTDYIKRIYKPELTEAYKASLKEPLSQTSIMLAGKEQVIRFDQPLEGIALVNAAAEEIRKKHSKEFFGTESLVIFPKSESKAEMRRFEWNGFQLTLPQAPKDYHAFVEAIRLKLNAIYLERTRTQMMNALIAGELDYNDQYLAPFRIEGQLKHHKAFKKTASFDIVDIPLESAEIKEDNIKKAAGLFAEKVGKSLEAQEARSGLLQKVAQEVSQEISFDLKVQSINHTDILSTALLPPEDSRSLQLFQMLFAEELIKAGSDESKAPNLVYFVDRERKTLSFVLRTKSSRPEEVALKMSTPRLNNDRLEDEVKQQTYSDAHKKAIEKLFRKQIHVSIKDMSLFGMEGANRYNGHQEAIMKVILESVESADRLYPGSGWAKFLRGAYLSPITPTDLKLSKKEKVKEGFLRLF